MRKLYTIRDTLVGYGVDGVGVPAIIDLPNDDVLIRVMKGSCGAGAKANYLNVNPENKEVYCIGEFDQKTGRIIPCEPRLVARSIDYIERSPEDVHVESSSNAEESKA